MTRQNWKNTQDLNELSFETRTLSLEFGETSLFYIGHSKGCKQKKDLFLKKHNNNHFFARKCTDQQR